MASVTVRLDGGDQVVTASITKEAVEELRLETGKPAMVLIKSTEVVLGVERRVLRSCGRLDRYQQVL